MPPFPRGQVERGKHTCYMTSDQAVVLTGKACTLWYLCWWLTGTGGVDHTTHATVESSAAVTWGLVCESFCEESILFSSMGLSERGLATTPIIAALTNSSCHTTYLLHVTPGRAFGRGATLHCIPVISYIILFCVIHQCTCWGWGGGGGHYHADIIPCQRLATVVALIIS